MVCGQVSLQLALYHLVEMNERAQTLTTNCEIITKWHDVFLMWDPARSLPVPHCTSCTSLNIPPPSNLLAPDPLLPPDPHLALGHQVRLNHLHAAALGPGVDPGYRAL